MLIGHRPHMTIGLSQSQHVPVRKPRNDESRNSTKCTAQVQRTVESPTRVGQQLQVGSRKACRPGSAFRARSAGAWGHGGSIPAPTVLRHYLIGGVSYR
jgi:hypothetical protein